MTDGYSYRTTWSEADQEWVGICDQHPGLSHFDETEEAALAGIKALVRGVEEADAS